jgi:glucokinase
MPAVILAADVGGTKTHLALYEPGDPPRKPALERRVPSRDYDSLGEILRGFLDDAGRRPRFAAVGIAGPVVDNASDTTNLPWTVSGRALTDAVDAPVRLLNDLEAAAWGVAALDAGDLMTLQPGRPAEGNRALIAAGTGLGEAFLVRTASGWQPSASEGGHADFAPHDPLEDELLGWLRARHGGHVSWERVLSGPGLADLYRFLADTGKGEASPEVAKAFAEAEDPAAVVTAAALEGMCGRAAMALERFVRLYGAEAGNLALKGLALGGLYVGGGIAPRILEALERGDFVASFNDKGRLRPVLERIPVHVILRPETALWGAAAFAFAHVTGPVTEEVS